MTATNPFDDTTRAFLVLVNEERQHSLWPADLTVPAGWSTAAGPAPRDTCTEYVETHWTDIRPAGQTAAH